MNSSTAKSSADYSSKLCSIFSNDKPQGFLFKNYSSSNLNNLLGSDFKFKSPSKLMEAKIDLSPWKCEENYRVSFSKMFESSPLRASNYKLTREEMEASQRVQRIHTKDLPALENTPREFQSFQTIYSTPYVTPNLGQIQHRPITETSDIKHQLSSNEDQGSQDDQYDLNRKRKRKNTVQLKVLKAEYLKNKEWSKELITKISEMTGLTESQIYKWNWDQKKKDEETQTNAQSICHSVMKQ